MPSNAPTPTASWRFFARSARQLVSAPESAAEPGDVRLPAVDRRTVALLARERFRLAEERLLVVQRAGARDSLEADWVDLDRHRVLAQLPLEPLVVRPYPTVDGEDELEIPRDRLLRVEERCELEAEARILRRAVVRVDVPVEWFRSRRRIDGRRLAQCIGDLARLVQLRLEPREGVAVPLGRVSELVERRFHRLEHVAVPERPV